MVPVSLSTKSRHVQGLPGSAGVQGRLFMWLEGEVR